METMPLHHIAELVFNRPLLIHPEKAEQILAVLQGRLPISQQADLFKPAAEQLLPELSGFSAARKQRADKSTTLFRAAGGVGVIRVVGSLVNRGAWLDANSGLVSYEGIAAQLADAVKDPDIKSILFDIQSFGGEAAGMYGLATAIREARKSKPVTAVVNDVAASAAYGIASSANNVIVSPTSGVGSIGVVLVHLDRSQEMAKTGVKPTLIFAGAHKVDGNPFEPLSAAVQQDLQELVQQHYQAFVETVYRGRGAALTADAARGTEARMFLGKDAVKNGLADDVGTFDEVLADMQTGSGKSRAKTGGTTMETVSKADHDAAVAKATADGKALGTTEGHAAGKAEGVTEGTAAGVTMERERATGIFNLDATKGREAQAAALVASGSTVEAAKTVLEAAPKTDALPPRTLGKDGNLAAAEANKVPEASSLWDRQVLKTNARIN